MVIGFFCRSLLFRLSIFIHAGCTIMANLTTGTMNNPSALKCFTPLFLHSLSCSVANFWKFFFVVRFDDFFAAICKTGE